MAEMVRAPRAVRIQAGETLTARVIGVEMIDETEFETRAVKVDPVTGNPVKMLRLDLAMPNGETRALYVRGNPREGSQSLRDAVRSACRSAGVRMPQIGHRITVRRLDDVPSKTPEFNPRQVYAARLEVGGHD